MQTNLIKVRYEGFWIVKFKTVTYGPLFLYYDSYVVLMV